jgi:hypothetical protein
VTYRLPAVLRRERRVTNSSSEGNGASTSIKDEKGRQLAKQTSANIL